MVKTEFERAVLSIYPDTATQQLEKLYNYEELLLDWNQKINLISRKDTENVLYKHILHSLTIGNMIRFKENTRVLDLGTGGGLPAIPLAIVQPGVTFTAIDARNKKIKAVTDIVERLGLDNVGTLHARAEEHRGSYEFIVTRAVASLHQLWQWILHLRDLECQRHALPNGLIALKGGDLAVQLKELPRRVYSEVHPLSLFEDKHLVYLQF